MTTATLDYDNQTDLTSFVSVRYGRYSHALIPRHTEIAGIDRRAYGGRKEATDSAAEVATKKNNELRCSDCKRDKEYTEFPRSSRFLHRHSIPVQDKKGHWKLWGHGYQCSQCKHNRYAEHKAAALALTLYEQQAKPVKLTKKQKKRAQRKLDKIA